MAKSKGKKKNLSEKIQSKRTKPKSSTKSPFEVHINKQKLKVLGRKTKHDKGFPGLSRSKAIDKRKKTLLEEFKVRNKSNVFKDRRIAERDPTLSVEEKQMVRFAAIRRKAHKKSIFNLGDDDNSLYPDEEDILTHKGQALSEIEKFEDPRSDDEIDNEDDGKLDKKFVEKLHFGGGFLTSTRQEGAKSHKDILEEIIAESKKRKAEKKQTKDEIMELTENYDDGWKDLLPFATFKTRKLEDKTSDPRVKMFGKSINKSKFDPRGTPSDPVKSEDEVAKKEEERLERLEKERLDRMMGIDEDDSNIYRSADDLDDNFVYESLSENENNEEENDNESNEKENQNGICEDENESNEGDDEEETQNGISEDDDSEEENQNGVSSEHDDDDDENMVDTEDNPSEEETDNEDDLSDLKADTSESEEEDIDEGKSASQKRKNLEQQVEKRLVEEQNEDIPLTFSFPEDDEQLQSLLKDHSAVNQGIIIERIIKCFHASLSEGNKSKLGLLFKYILQYINDMASEAQDAESLRRTFSIFDVLAPHLFDLAQMNQKTCHDAVLEVIKEKFEEYIKKPKLYPDLEVLFFFKLVSLLFPTSDFKHSVVTPCFLFIEKMLMSCRVRTRKHIAYGLFLSTLVLEFTTLSKRYMPGCLNFLGGIIHMAIPKSTVRIIKVLPPFKSLSSDLVLLEDNSSSDYRLKMEIEDLVDEEITESFKVRAICTAIRIIMEFFNNFKEYPSNLEIFEPIYQYCKLLNLDMYPKEVEKDIKSFIDSFEDSVKSRNLVYLKMEAAKPKLLRLYEPNIVEVYDRKTHKVQSKEKAERSKLIHKLKREKKGALREIRRDNAFLGRVKITQQIESDNQRKEAVKRIYAEANIQQSELNELDRKKKKK
ncbi:nucleolar protein 14 homolog [Coccinella septempunctata]|uniref:nucleolar protein 14 homolog n=1 Tax=Coccinella septempunctata TaxID=41139 RepID=UPI001D0686EB|nr:nucleolar protein 14 homolog [Coccinella septempunctata]